MNDQLVLYYSSSRKIKQLVVMGAAAVGLGFCGYLSYGMGETLVSIIAIVVVGVLLAAIIEVVRKFSKTEPRFIINCTGIKGMHSKSGLIPWEDIEEITTGKLRIKYSSEEYIGIKLKPGSSSAQRFSLATDEIAKEVNNIFRIINLSETGSDLRLFVSGHNATVEEIRGHIVNLKEAYHLPINIR